MIFAEPVRPTFKTCVKVAPPSRGKGRSSPVRTVVVHEMVWKTAMRLAGGDAHRIEVVNEEEVVVRNRR